MVNISTVVFFSQLSFSNIFHFLRDPELQELPKRGLKRLSMYGSYILAHDLIIPVRGTMGFIHLDGFDPLTYNMFRLCQRRQISSDFRTSLRAEMDQRLQLRMGSACILSMRGG
jgi:hypothetical protein